MPEVKLARLPDRTPVRLTPTITHVACPPRRLRRGLGSRIRQGRAVSELIPAMLAAFLDSDHGFRRRGGR